MNRAFGISLNDRSGNPQRGETDPQTSVGSWDHE